MGIKNFYKFIQKYSPNSIMNKSLGEYYGKCLGIDANLLLYKLLAKNIGFLYYKYKDNITIETLKILEENYEMFYIRLADLISFAYSKYNIKLIFIFDGKTPDIKKSTVSSRKIDREIAINNLDNFNEEIKEILDISDNNVDINFDSDEIIDDINNENNIITNDNLINLTKEELIKRKKNLLLKSLHLTSKLIKSVKEFLQICGIPYIDAPYESDSQLAWLSKNNFIDGIITNDYDILTFGGKTMILDFWNCTKKNLNEKIIKEINLKKFLKSINMKYENFVELCILMGSDYSEKPKYTFEYIYEVLTNNDGFKKNADKFQELPTNFDLDKIADYFKDPQCTNYTKENFDQFINSFTFNPDKIKIFLLDKRKIIITEKYIKKFLNNIIKYHNLTKIKKK